MPERLQFLYQTESMSVQFLLFVIAILLILIFWELSKINSRLKKTFVRQDIMKDNKRREP